MEKKDLLKIIFSTKMQIRLLHWQTTSNAGHKAFDEFDGEFNSLTDQLIEVYQGKYGRIETEGLTVTANDISKVEPKKYFDYLYEVYSESVRDFFEEEDTDMINILDEIIALINKTRYLLTLK